MSENGEMYESCSLFSFCLTSLPVYGLYLIDLLPLVVAEQIQLNPQS